MSNNNFRPLAKARPIIQRLHVQVLSAGQRPQLISYDCESGLYVLGDRPILVAAQEECPRNVKKYHVGEIVDAVRRNALVIDPWQVNNPQRRIIVFKNGVLDLVSGKLKPHSHHWLYTIGIPHNYNPNATCPHFESFIKQILPGDHHNFIKQLLGHLLIPSAEFRKFEVFLGSGANGKSTLLQMIEAMLGRANVSNQSLHLLAQNRFAAFELFGKLANTYADLDDAEVSRTGLLKQITGGDTISYERKFRSPFSAPVTARLVFSANKMPHIPDDSKAISDRLIMVEFPNRFEEAQQDKRLIDKLTTEEELEGILARWAVPGLHELLSNGQFDIPIRSWELVHGHVRDPFSDFVQERLEASPSSWISRQDLYGHYICWCEDRKVARLSQQEFNRHISKYFEIPEGDWRLPGTRNRAWPDIQLLNGVPVRSEGQKDAFCVSGSSPGKGDSNGQ